MSDLTTEKEEEKEKEEIPISFSEFPEDVQLTILSFLDPPEISSFASTSRRFSSLCNTDSKLWFSLCHRRWGSKTQIPKWGSGKITYRRLYNALSQLHNLLGFWRRSGSPGHNNNTICTETVVVPPPPLVFFEWGSSCIVGSRVSAKGPGSYEVEKRPFLWVCLGEDGEWLSFLDPGCRVGITDDAFLDDLLVSGCEFGELVPVNVNFIGKCHVVVEENSGFGYSNGKGKSKSKSPDGRKKGGSGVVEDGGSGSLPDQFMSEMYQHFANRTSPGGERWSRRHRRKEKERHGRMKWETEHFVKIVNCSPTPSRPLQGLWKGFCDDMNLDFYLVAYDDIGGIACRRVEDSSKPFSVYAPVFWTSDATFIESPFSPQEQYIYDSRVHLRPPEASDRIHGCLPSCDNEAVSSILYINSSYDLVIPDLVGTNVNPRQVEGRLWLYSDGTFGFGFLRNNHIVDLKNIAKKGSVLDIVELCN